jgi:hypothetical protein
MFNIIRLFINSLKITYLDLIFYYKLQSILKQLVNIKIPIRTVHYDKRTKAIVLTHVNYGSNCVILHRIKTNNLYGKYRYNPNKPHSETILTLREAYRLLFLYYSEGAPILKGLDFASLRVIELRIEKIVKANNQMRFTDTSRFHKG